MGKTIQLVVNMDLFLDGFESGDTGAWSTGVGPSEPTADSDSKREVLVQ